MRTLRIIGRAIRAICLTVWARRPHVHRWTAIIPAYRPQRADWHCHLRHCRCGRVQYEAFATFGDKQWHDLSERPTGIWQSEHDAIMESVRHYGLRCARATG